MMTLKAKTKSPLVIVHVMALGCVRSDEDSIPKFNGTPVRFNYVVKTRDRSS
jgi:hypothetical protein